MLPQYSKARVSHNCWGPNRWWFQDIWGCDYTRIIELYLLKIGKKREKNFHWFFSKSYTKIPSLLIFTKIAISQKFWGCVNIDAIAWILRQYKSMCGEKTSEKCSKICDFVELAKIMNFAKNVGVTICGAHQFTCTLNFRSISLSVSKIWRKQVFM